MTPKARIAAAASVVVGALALSPSPAPAGMGCPKFRPVEPRESSSRETAKAPKAPVLLVTDKATQKKPVVVEYEHGPAFWLYPPYEPVVESTEFINLQVVSRHRLAPLNVRVEWPTPSASEIDVTLYDSDGYYVDGSYSFNQPVLAELGNQAFGGQGGHGFELITDIGAYRCEGFTVESLGFWTAGETMTLKAWLGDD